MYNEFVKRAAKLLQRIEEVQLRQKRNREHVYVNALLEGADCILDFI